MTANVVACKGRFDRRADRTDRAHIPVSAANPHTARAIVLPAAASCGEDHFVDRLVGVRGH